MMEASVSKFGMILDSVQSDVMQVKKGTKEVLMEMETIQQKLMAQDSSLQLLIKRQEVLKARLDDLKSILEKQSKNENQDKLQEMFLMLSALPEKIEASLVSSRSNTHTSFIKEMQKLLCSTQTCQNQITYPIQTSKVLIVLSPKAPKERNRFIIELDEDSDGGFSCLPCLAFAEEFGHMQERNIVTIELDEDSDGGFSCLPCLAFAEEEISK